MSWQLVGNIAGKKASHEEVIGIIKDAVAEAFASLPKPKDGTDGANGSDGTSVSVEQLAPMVSSEVAKALGAIRIPEPVSVSGALIDRDGGLVLTLSDGSTKAVGNVVGRDGFVDMDALRRLVVDEVAKIPPPKDGINGQNGTLENLKVEWLNDRTCRFCFKDGTPVEGSERKFGFPLFREVFTTARTYEAGDVVQRDGSGWIALVDNPPGTPGVGKPEATGWKLFIKRGDVGKPGPMGPEGPQGKSGPMGPQGKSGY